MKQFLLLLLVVFSINQLSAQKDYDLKTADENYRQYAYSDAVEGYLKINRKNPDNEYVIQQIAYCYQKMGMYKEALFYYEKVVNGNRARNEDFFQYAGLLLMDGQFGKAKQELLEYQKKVPTDKRAVDQIDRIENFSKLNLLRLVDTVFCDPFNTRFSDMSAAFYKKSIAYVSARDSSDGNTYSWNDQPFLDIYEIDVNENGDSSIVKMDGVNTKYHEGPMIFTDNDQTIWFTRNNQKFTGSNLQQTNNLRMYSYHFINGKWKDKEDFQYNSDKYSVGHPAFSPDGSTMYFASNMEGSVGETDIYKVKKVEKTNKKGKKYYEWSEPENLGKQFNTQGREMFPFVDSRGVLFFASDGLAGFGGLDIFAAFPVADSFNVVNLGQPVNSTYDDFSFIVSNDFSHGYLTSDRTGGVGSDDIYSFHIGKQKLYLKVKSLKNNEPIANSTIKATVDGSSSVLGKTDQNGLIVIDVDYNKKYYFDIQHPDYIENNDSLLAFQIFKIADHSKTIYLDNTSLLQVLVVDEKTGDPISSVSTKLTLADGSVQTLMTDASGKIKQPLESTGKIIVSTNKERYTSAEGVVNVNNLGQGNYNITLKMRLMQLLISVINEETGEPIPYATVALTLADGTYNKLKTDSLGKMDYIFKGPGNINIAASKEKFLASETNVTIDKQITGNYSVTVELSPVYEGKTFVLENLYYDLGKSNIRPDAAIVLDKLYKILVENPEIRIELSSHTDSRASAEYNMSLSQRRAQAAVNYLISKGIDKNRMAAVGYGETKLLNKCADGVPCTEEEHQQNRRTEFKVLGGF